MDIIDIDSSDSEDEIEVRQSSHGRSSSSNGTRSHNQNPGPGMTSGNGIRSDSGPGMTSGNGVMSNGREGASFMPDGGAFDDFELDGFGEGTTWDADATSSHHTQRRTLPPSLQPGVSSSHHTQRRTLPTSLQPGVSRPSSGSSVRSHGANVYNPQVKERGSVKPSNGYVAGLSGIASDKQKADMKLLQDGHKRKLPSSLQPGMYKLPSQGSVDYRSDKLGMKKEVHMYGTDDRRRDLPSSSMYGGDIHMYKNAGTQRALPPSLMSGTSAINSQLVGANDAGNRSGLVEERLIEHDERPVFQEALQNLSQPKMEDDLPDGLLSVTLLKHQKIALAWMVQREKSFHCTGGILADDQGLGKTISMIALVQKQRTSQSKFTSDDSCQKKSEALNLDDDDDDGETTEPNKEFERGDIKRKEAASTSMRTSGKGKPPAGTLVVCPASIVRQWEHELEEKVTSSAKLSVLIYHGGTRTRDPGDLAKYDVVLTTYSIVTNEVPHQPIVDDDDGEQRNLDKYGISSEFSTNKKRKQNATARTKGKKKGKGHKDSIMDSASGPLARVRWFRVILDEAQTIKNHRTQVARACSGLRAKRRWCLSGTPIQNSIDDLFSYFRFLKYEPYCHYSSFCNMLKYPISRDASVGYKKLQTLLRIVLLRRTKGTLIDGEPVVKLPPKTVVLKKVDFSQEERSFYLKLEADSRQQFKAYAAAGTLKQNYANILLMLLRLRQACDHPVLVKEYRSDTVGKDSLEMARQLPRDMLVNLLSQLEASMAICLICNDPPEDAVVTMCGHVFCFQCISERLTGDESMCPATGCKDRLGTDLVFSRATLKRCLSDERYDNNASTSVSACDEESSIVQSGYVSSKIKAVIEILNSLCSPTYNIGSNEFEYGDCKVDMDLRSATCSHFGSDPAIPAKTIIFSQWTGMLNLVEYSLNISLIQYRRLDGTMTLNARDRAVSEFNTDPEVTVMLMSLKAGNLGLNMVAACHVILLDLWWNPTTEDQAIDRAHRIGQTRPVTVSRLTIKDTVEDRILALQEEKRKLVSSAFGEDPTGQSHATRLSMEDLRYLFRM